MFVFAEIIKKYFFPCEVTILLNTALEIAFIYIHVLIDTSLQQQAVSLNFLYIFLNTEIKG